jgi:hypothetical protein
MKECASTSSAPTTPIFHRELYFINWNKEKHDLVRFKTNIFFEPPYSTRYAIAPIRTSVNADFSMLQWHRFQFA